MALLFKMSIKRRDYVEVQDKMDIVRNWTQTTFMGNIQPAKGRDVGNMEEGSYSVGSVKVYSEIPLPVRKEGNPGTPGTFVLFEGDWYELIAKMPYSNGGLVKTLDHYKYIAAPRTNKEAGL